MTTLAHKTWLRFSLYALLILCVVVLAWYQRGALDFQKETPPAPNTPSHASRALWRAHVVSEPPAPALRMDSPRMKRPIDVALSNVTISQAIADLAAKTNLNIGYRATPQEQRISLFLTHVPTGRVLQTLADLAGGSWQQEQEVFLLRPSQMADASPAQPLVTKAVPSRPMQMQTALE